MINRGVRGGHGEMPFDAHAAVGLRFTVTSVTFVVDPVRIS
jgi:hypothetical protein